MQFPDVNAGDNPLKTMSATRHNALNKLLQKPKEKERPYKFEHEIPEAKPGGNTVLCLNDAATDIPIFSLAVITGFGLDYDKTTAQGVGKYTQSIVVKVKQANSTNITEDLFQYPFVIVQQPLPAKNATSGAFNPMVPGVVGGLSFLWLDTSIQAATATSLYDGAAPSASPGPDGMAAYCYGGPIRILLQPESTGPALVYLDNTKPQIRWYRAAEDIPPSTFAPAIKLKLGFSGYTKSTTNVEDQVYNAGSQVIDEGTDIQVVCMEGRLTANWEDCSA